MSGGGLAAPQLSWCTKGRTLLNCTSTPSFPVHLVIIYVYSLSLLTDASALFGTLDKTLFPGLPSTISVHSGFRDAHAASAAAVLATVKKIIAEKGATKVAVSEYPASDPPIYMEINVLGLE